VAPTPKAAPAPVTAASTHHPEVTRPDPRTPETEVTHPDPIAQEPGPRHPHPRTHPHPPIDEQQAHAILESVLDDLGTAHHRPFSRG
jgi:hypothetical protein